MLTLLLRTTALLLAWAAQPAGAATIADAHVSEWSVLDVKGWLSDALKLPAVGVEAERDSVDGRAAQAMDKQDWRELGASGLKAAKIVGAMKSLRDAAPAPPPAPPPSPPPSPGLPDGGAAPPELCERRLATRTATVLTTVGDGSRTEPVELPAALVGGGEEDEEANGGDGGPGRCSADGAARSGAIPAPTDPAEALQFFLAMRNATLSGDWKFVARAHATLQRRCAAATITRAQLEKSLEDGLLLLQMCGFVRVDGAFPQSRRALRRQKTAGALDLSKLLRAVDRRWPDGKPPLTGYEKLVNILRGEGRFELSFPFEPPFNDTALTSPSVMTDLVKAYLNNNAPAPHNVPIRLDQVGCIVTMPNAGLQEAHWDHPAVHDIHRSAEESELLKQLPTGPLKQILSGHSGYSIKMTVPLVDVSPDLAPIHVCAGSHREELRVTDVVAKSSDDALAGYLRRHCSTTLLGVGSFGDALLYDPRLLHWGGANTLGIRRPVVDLQYVQSWVPPEFSYRPLTEAGREQADHFRNIEL